MTDKKEKIETQKIEPEKPSYEKLVHAAELLQRRNNDLEMEVGRLHMIVRAYDQQFTDMRKVIEMLQSKLDKQVEPDDL